MAPCSRTPHPPKGTQQTQPLGCDNYSHYQACFLEQVTVNCYAYPWIYIYIVAVKSFCYSSELRHWSSSHSIVNQVAIYINHMCTYTHVYRTRYIVVYTHDFGIGYGNHSYMPIYIYIYLFSDLQYIYILHIYYIYITYIYMKSSFSKRVKRHSRKWACNFNAKFKDCVLITSFSHMYICVYMYIFMKSSFPKHNLRI